MGAVLHTLNIRLFPEQLIYIVNHAQDKVILVDDSLVAAAREGRRPSSRPSSTTWSSATATWLRCPNAIALRGAARRARSPASTTRSSTSARPPGSATRAGRPATRRASSTRTARTSCTRWGSAWRTRFGIARVRPRPAGRADVPRQRVGPAVRGVHGRRRPDHAQPLPAGRAAGAADRVREGHGRRRGADDLARRPALRRRAQARPLEPADRGRAAAPPSRAADAGVRGAPRHADHPGVGHDRDEPARLRRAPAGGAAEGEEHWNYRSTAGPDHAARRRRG